MTNEMYEEIWLSFNQNNLIREIDEEFTIKQSELTFSEVEKSFDNNVNYKFINLDFINSHDKHYLKEKKILLEHLVRNFKNIIFKDKTKISYDAREFQIQVIKDKFIYAICPFSGKIIKSNQSVIVTRPIIFYRFSNEDEVFYIITTHIGNGFKKGAIYFPKHELIIKYGCKDWWLTKEHIIQFKALIVCNFREFYYYFSSKNSTKKIAIIIGHPNFAHQIWNELSGIHRLYRKKYLHKIDKFFILRDTLGPINQIFPEIPINKIKYINASVDITNKTLISGKILQEIINNEYLVVNLGDDFIKNDLAERVYKVAVKNSSPEVINKVKEARKKHFPLLWISIRVGNRTLINQVDNLSKIINSLAKDFPQLGVVFDGFSLPSDYLTNPHLHPNNFEIETVERQHEIVNQIIDNLSDLKIGVFNTVGCSIGETNIWAHAIDIYLAHHGTIQHKVGWLANKPGIIHSNKKVLQRNQGGSNVSIREFGIDPIYINHIHARDINLDDEKIKRDVRNNLDNYDIDWTVLSNEVLKLTKSVASRRNLTGKLLNYLKESPKNLKKMLKPKLKRALHTIKNINK